MMGSGSRAGSGGNGARRGHGRSENRPIGLGVARAAEVCGRRRRGVQQWPAAAGMSIQTGEGANERAGLAVWDAGRRRLARAARDMMIGRGVASAAIEKREEYAAVSGWRRRRKLTQVAQFGTQTIDSGP